MSPAPAENGRGAGARRLCLCGATLLTVVGGVPAYAQGLSPPGNPNAFSTIITTNAMRGMRDDTADAATSDPDATSAPSSDGATSGQDDAGSGRVKAIAAVSGTAPPDKRPMFGRINLRETPIGQSGGIRPPEPLDQGPGIRAGAFVFRPEITESIGAESQKFGGTRTHRTFSQTEIRGTLTSDWSRHALTISGSGVYQKNISGTGETQPSADINADLRLDLADLTTVDLTAGYNLMRESVSDPNAIAGALNQSTINTFSGGAEISRDLGLLRGSLSAKAIRATYSDVRLANGTTLSQADRNTLAGEFAARIGYELSPALTPFMQMKYRRTDYDHGIDASGFRRSSDTYTAEAGLTTDFGEKLSGEFAAGYILRRFEDERLSDLGGLALDATGHWSPHRGTDVALGLATQIEDATAAGESGAVDYAVNADITQIVREDVVARLGAQYLLRHYRSGAAGADQHVYTATAGLSWYLSRYLSLDTDLSYQITTRKGVGDQTVASANVGLTLRR